jgi:hypothetical protein
MTAAECSRRWGVNIGTLRSRAAAQGWRRIDQPDDPDLEPLPLPLPPDPPAGRGDPGDLALEPEEAPDLPDGPADYAGMARRALARFDRALARGAATEAATWLRLHARLLDLCRPSSSGLTGGPPAAAPSRTSAPPRPRPPRAPDRVDTIQACAREVEVLTRAMLKVADDDEEAHAALDARAAALDARIAALTGDDDPSEFDSFDSFDSLFSALEADADQPP